MPDVARKPETRNPKPETRNPKPETRNNLCLSVFICGLISAMDKILLHGLVFYGRHGCHEAERELGQKFVVDIEASCDLSLACKTDKVADTVDYISILNATRDIIGGESALLLESLAQRIADFCFTDNRVLDVRVRIRKPHVAVPNALDYLGIEIFRQRENAHIVE